MRARLGWIRQIDSHSCGPLSTAAAMLLLQGWRIDSWRKIENPLSRTTGRAAPPALLIWLRAATGFIGKHSQNIYLEMRRKIRHKCSECPPNKLIKTLCEMYRCIGYPQRSSNCTPLARRDANTSKAFRACRARPGDFCQKGLSFCGSTVPP